MEVSRVVRWKGEQVGEEGGGGVVVAEVRLKKGGGGSQRGSTPRVNKKGEVGLVRWAFGFKMDQALLFWTGFGIGFIFLFLIRLVFK